MDMKRLYDLAGGKTYTDKIAAGAGSGSVDITSTFSLDKIIVPVWACIWTIYTPGSQEQINLTIKQPDGPHFIHTKLDSYGPHHFYNLGSACIGRLTPPASESDNKLEMAYGLHPNTSIICSVGYYVIDYYG